MKRLLSEKGNVKSTQDINNQAFNKIYNKNLVRNLHEQATSK